MDLASPSPWLTSSRISTSTSFRQGFRLVNERASASTMGSGGDERGELRYLVAISAGLILWKYFEKSISTLMPLRVTFPAFCAQTSVVKTPWRRSLVRAHFGESESAIPATSLPALSKPCTRRRPSGLAPDSRGWDDRVSSWAQSTTTTSSWVTRMTSSRVVRPSRALRRPSWRRSACPPRPRAV